MELATRKQTLNDILKDFHDIEEMLIESGGELTPDIEQLLDQNAVDLDSKLDGYASFIDYLKGQVEYLKNVEAQFKDHRQTVENAIRRMKSRVLYALKATGNEKHKTAMHSYSIKLSESWKVDEDRLDQEQKGDLVADGLAEFVFKPSITGLKNAYKGAPIPDWVDVTVNESVQIR
ncbi:MAG: siphovirus Gp157 family protein [Candidatus Marinimicrobia bacterium]|nr:siphovirus Gp157 family protein [Candidatus Neomarinimicrobiota bacterium]